ncbi:MAG: hypothetical protein ACR2GY_00845 [Phycisphaerales bacterium]
MHRFTRLTRPIVMCVLACLAGCSTSIKVENPAAQLSDPEQSPRVFAAVITALEAQPTLSDDEIKALRGMMYRAGYTVPSRERALELLAQREPELLKETLTFRLAQLGALEWRRRLCEIIAERNWVDLTPGLIRAWAVPISGWTERDAQRPERLALAQLHGEDRVHEVVFATMLENNSVAQQGLRNACWTLLVQSGERGRLVELLAASNVSSEDAMLNDLRASATELAIVPANHEEILWVRKLRQPEHSQFWERARTVVSSLPQHVRASLALRDVPILVAIAEHEPALLQETRDALYARVETMLEKAERHGYAQDRSYSGYVGTNNQSLRQHRDELTWGDLAAMLMALRAMQVPEVVEHFFDFAERDRADTSTEYGGVMQLDAQNRFELLEFPPRVRMHDNRFQASQEMFDAGYLAAFHFHFHAQKHKNSQHAGPGLGDSDYADATRANCLVLTFIDSRTLNVDWYRHGRIVVDLGDIRRSDR